MTGPAEPCQDQQVPAGTSDITRTGRHGQGLHSAAASMADSVEVRCDVVEVSMDLSRLVEALGPDVLFEVPMAFRGERNMPTVRELISGYAATLPGFVAEIVRTDPLCHFAFRVEGRHEQEFVVGLRTVVREILLEPRSTPSGAARAKKPAAIPEAR